MTDSEIIRLIINGDRQVFRMLVEKYQSMVFRTCMGFVHNKDDADDLTQDIFIQTYQSLQGFKGDAAFSTWIYRISVTSVKKKLEQLFSEMFVGDIQIGHNTNSGPNRGRYGRRSSNQ
jgi:RNA polymerase sigma factor (sigma-70 family)